MLYRCEDCHSFLHVFEGQDEGKELHWEKTKTGKIVAVYKGHRCPARMPVYIREI